MPFREGEGFPEEDFTLGPVWETVESGRLVPAPFLVLPGCGSGLCMDP